MSFTTEQLDASAGGAAGHSSRLHGVEVPESPKSTMQSSPQRSFISLMAASKRDNTGEMIQPTSGNGVLKREASPDLDSPQESRPRRTYLIPLIQFICLLALALASSPSTIANSQHSPKEMLINMSALGADTTASTPPTIEWCGPHHLLFVKFGPGATNGEYNAFWLYNIEDKTTRAIAAPIPGAFRGCNRDGSVLYYMAEVVKNRSKTLFGLDTKNRKTVLEISGFGKEFPATFNPISPSGKHVLLGRNTQIIKSHEPVPSVFRYNSDSSVSKVLDMAWGSDDNAYVLEVPKEFGVNANRHSIQRFSDRGKTTIVLPETADFRLHRIAPAAPHRIVFIGLSTKRELIEAVYVFDLQTNKITKIFEGYYLNDQVFLLPDGNILVTPTLANAGPSEDGFYINPISNQLLKITPDGSQRTVVEELPASQWNFGEVRISPDGNSLMYEKFTVYDYYYIDDKFVRIIFLNKK